MTIQNTSVQSHFQTISLFGVGQPTGGDGLWGGTHIYNKTRHPAKRFQSFKCNDIQYIIKQDIRQKKFDPSIAMIFNYLSDAILYK